MQNEITQRCGYVALIGAPNAGKSTLLNRLVGSKVSIVTHKVQTTRAIIRGIVLAGKSQIIFVDTPGIFKPKRRLDKAMVNTAWSGARGADVVALLVDARKVMMDGDEKPDLDADLEIILQAMERPNFKAVLIINKIDMLKREKLLHISQELNKRCKFDDTFMISALNGDGCDGLIDYFTDRMPEGPWLFPEDEISDMPMRILASEITREKVYLRLHDELPYASTVETEAWKVMRDGSLRIEQTIFVERPSQKKIVLGKGGQTIKWISTKAREEITECLQQKVHLFLFVKLRENWADDPERYRNMGLDFPT